MESVNKFSITNMKEICWRDNELLFNGRQIARGKIYSFEDIENTIIINLQDGKEVIAYFIETQEIRKIEKNGSLLTGNILLTGQWNSDYSERLIKATKIKDNIFLWQTNEEISNVFVFDNQHFISKTNNKIVKRELITATPLWQYDLSILISEGASSDIPEVSQIVGVIDDCLFIKLKSNEIIVLNINSGSLVERLRFIDELIGESSIKWATNDIPFFNTKYTINEKEKTIQALFVDLYYEIAYADGKTYTKVYSLWDEYKKHGINPQDISKNNVIQDDKLYFLAYNQGKFAILNTVTKEIDYISDPIMIEDKTDRFSQLKEIQVSGDKVYVLASDGILHIFEKET